MMAIFMPTDFKSVSINNFLKLQYPSPVAAHESRSHFNIGVVESAMSNAVSSAPALASAGADPSGVKLRLCSDDDSVSNDSDLSVGQEKMPSEQSESNNNVSAVKEPPPLSSDVDDEEMSNASSSQYTTNSSTRLCSPQNPAEIMRPMHFHEEIIRSSQLYAEELLRQRIAAAARLQGAVDEPEPSIISKLSFQSNMFSAAAAASKHNDTGAENGNGSSGGVFCAKSAINFQNIHSHLSAISQITHSLGSGVSGSSLKKDDATSLSSLSRESSQSPSGFQQFKQHHHHHHPQSKHLGFHTAANQFHDHSLKFSIDNILKADFGRRITEPLLKTARTKRKLEKEKLSKFGEAEALNQQHKEPHNSTVTKDKSSSEQAGETSKGDAAASGSTPGSSSGGTVWPAWVFCTRYSDRPSSGRSPRVKKKKPPSEAGSAKDDEKRPRTAFSGAQLARLKHEFNENRYLTEKRRQQLSAELGLNEAQIKIWFQNKRAKIKKSSGTKNPLAIQLMAQGLYNHSTVPLSKEEEEMQELQSGN